MNIRRFLLKLTLGVLACSNLAWAHPTLLAPIVITASRTPLPLNQVPAPVIVITRRDIRESGAETVPGLIRFYAGLDVSVSGGPGQPASVFIRGANSSQTLVLLNGVKINGGNIGLPPLQNVSLNAIQRIVIVEGPTAALYGSDGIGGVIDIITRGHTRHFHAHIGLGAGRYGTTTESAGASDGNASIQGGVDIHHEETNGFPPQTASPLSAGFENTTVQAFLRARVPTGHLELRQWQSTGQTDYLSYNLAPLSEDYNNRVLSLAFDSQPIQGWSSTWLVSRYVNQLNQNQGPDFALTRRYALDWQNNIRLSRMDLLTAGLYIQDSHTASLVFGTGYDVHTWGRAVYVENDWHTGPSRLLLTVRRSDNEDFGSHNEWNLGWNEALSSHVRVDLSWGSGFRAPSAEDRFGFGGNPNLLPESSHEVDLGFHYRWPEVGHFGIDGYEDTLTNLIVYLNPTVQYPEGINENIGRARIQGVDITYAKDFGHWRVRAEGVIQNPRDLVTGQTLARRARRSLTAALHYHQSLWYAGVEWLATGPRPDSPYTTTIDPGYVVTNAVAGLHFATHWSAALSLVNVFGVHYTEVAGYNTEGRALFVHVLWHY